MNRRRPRPRPGVLGQPRAGLRRAGAPRWTCTWSSRWSRPGASPSTPTWRSPATARNLLVRGFAALHPADDFEFTIRSDIPLSGGLGTSAAAIVAGLAGRRLALRARRRPAGRGDAARGPPRQRRGGAARRLRALRGRPRRALRPAGRAGGGARRARRGRCAPPRRARRCPREVPMADAVFNVAPRLAARARPRPRRPRPRRARARRPPAPAAPRAPLPALDGAGRARAPSSARSARRSPAPARPCSCGATSRTPARSPTAAARAESAGWAEVLRVPFAAQRRRGPRSKRG